MFLTQLITPGAVVFSIDENSAEMSGYATIWMISI